MGFHPHPAAVREQFGRVVETMARARSNGP